MIYKFFGRWEKVSPNFSQFLTSSDYYLMCTSYIYVYLNIICILYLKTTFTTLFIWSTFSYVYNICIGKQGKGREGGRGSKHQHSFAWASHRNRGTWLAEREAFLGGWIQEGFWLAKEEEGMASQEARWIGQSLIQWKGWFLFLWFFFFIFYFRPFFLLILEIHFVEKNKADREVVE